MMPSISEMELLRFTRKPKPSRVREYFHRAATAAVVSKCYENIRDPAASAHYQNEAVYFTAKGLEALAFETAKGNN